MGDGTVQLYDHGGVNLFRSPEEVLAEAQRAARALKDVVVQTKAAIKLGNSEHLKVEAWQTLGHFYGLTARVRETRYVEFGGVQGWEAIAELVSTDGRIVSSADAMCLNDEERWSTRAKYEYQNGQKVKVGDERVPLFQLRSMAQTRAISKVHSNALKWVVVLAGYNPTPAEEVEDGVTEDKPKRSMPQKKTGGISEGHWKRLWAIASGRNMTPQEIADWLKENGHDAAQKGADIPLVKYEAIIKALEEMNA